MRNRGWAGAWALSWSAVASAAAACGSNASPDAAASSSPSSAVASSSAAASSSGSKAQGAIAPSPATTSAPSTAHTEANAPATAEASGSPSSAASAEAEAPRVAYRCGENGFEKVGTFHDEPELWAPNERSELPAAFEWKPCNGGAADCNELDLGGLPTSAVKLDLSTPRGPLLIASGGGGLCAFVLSIDLEGNVQTAIELRDPSSATLGKLAVGQGGYMVDVTVSHPGKAPLVGWLIGSALMPPATAMADAGDETNDAISDHLWYDAKKGAFGILGSAATKGKFEKPPSRFAVVHGSVLALADGGAKLTVRANNDETDVVSPEAGKHIAGFDASPNLLAWVESNDSECTLHTSPFALTPLGRAAPLKPKELAKVPCDGASEVAIERGWVAVGNDLVNVANGKRVPLADAVCGADKSPVCAHGALLGATDTHVYFHAGSQIERVATTSLASAAN